MVHGSPGFTATEQRVPLFRRGVVLGRRRLP